MPVWMHRLLARPRALLLAALASLALCPAAKAGSPTLVPQPGVTAPASIAELASALKYDVNLIYEYVYTNIEYSPTYGVKKGALGTLLDGVGNDFDQSALLVALLRVSGYTASYNYGRIRLGAAAISAFYGVDVSNPCPFVNLLTQGGIPFTFYYFGPPDCTSILLGADIAHVWVTVTGGSLGSTTRVLDPSYKTYVSAPGINLATATGYNQSSFMTSAKVGATITANSIQNLNRANVGTSLTNYANSLISYIRTNNPTATTRDIIGGRYIQPLIQPYTLPTSLSYEMPGDVPVVWTGDIDNAYRTTLQIQIGGINKTYYSDQIYGHRLSIVYNGSNQPVLSLDGVTQGTGTAGATQVNYTVSFPFCRATSGPSSPSCGTGSTNLFSFQNVLKATAPYTYAIVNGWDFTGRGMVDFHRRQLNVNQAAGNANDSEAVLGEALNMIGYSWLAQVSASEAVADRLIQSKVVTHCNIGVAAQVNGPYVDIPGGFVGTSSLTADATKADTAFFTDGGTASALEWGTLAQNLARLNVGAVSTIKLLDIANAGNIVIYDATPANWSSVQTSLSGYSPGDLSEASGYISQGYRLILPQRGNLTEGLWTGVGYIGIGPTGTGLRQLTYKISSNLKGGYSTDGVAPGTTAEEVAFIGPPIVPYPVYLSGEPIDLYSGGNLYDHDDLAIGSAPFPLGLSFRRSYNSNNLYDKGPLGNGWTHGFSMSAAANSDGLKGFGQDSPIDGAVAIAALYVAQDLFSDAAKPFDKVLIASLVQRWMMDRLITNTVNVTLGSQGEQFVLLADGSYNPRLGSSSRLSLAGGSYGLKYKDGSALAFDTNGNVSSWTVPSGPSVSFAYDASDPPLLTSVSNSVGRSLTLSYNGAKQLTAVADNAWPPRAVSYTYDSSGNLASFSDPLGKVTTYAYTPTGGGAPANLLSQIFYPSNPTVPFVSNTYDTLGRVATQSNANGATWNYFFAGYRSEEDDAYGTQHVIYYNPRGKPLFDIQDAAGLNRVTATVYDGLDRLSTVTQPEGGSTSWTYDTTLNPWANNVATTTRNPKPGSPLSPTTTSYLYNPTFNKPIRVTDALGRISLMEYDPLTGNVLSTIADAGSAPHFNVQTKSTYNAIGLPTSTTDPMGTVTAYAYDDLGNRLSVTADAGPGRLNRTTTYAYNARGDVVSATDPRGNTVTSTYDDARRVVTTTAPPAASGQASVVTANTYDPDGRLLQVQRSAAGSILRTTSTTYTPSGKVATTTDPKGNVTRNAYDLLERLASVTDAEGRITQFTYDALSRPYRTYNTAIQAGPLVQRTYTADGQLATLADANGNATAFAYDGFDRLATTTYPLGSTETFAYDGLDNLTNRKTRAGSTIAFAYDTLNRLTTKTPPSGPVVTYGYDLNGRPTGVSDNSGTITSAVSPTGSTVTYGMSYAYDALNRLTGTTWDNAPAASAPTAGPLVNFGHTYSKVNQRTGQTTDDSTWLSYPAGVPSTTVYTANSLNQYTAVGGVTPTYDGNGNLTSDGTYTLGYDLENRLTSANGAGNTAAYAFDARGRRKARTVNGTTTISVTDADSREVLEYDGASGALLRWYAYALGPNAVLNQINVAASTRATLLPDQLGSIIASFDSGTGTLSRFGYQPYGGSASAATPFGYTGQRFDQESGLYYYRARHYSSKWGRFLQVDPLGPEWLPSSSSDSRGTYSGSTYSLTDTPGFPDIGLPVTRPFVAQTAPPTIEPNVAPTPPFAPSVPVQSTPFQSTPSVQLTLPAATTPQQLGSQHPYAYVLNDPLNLTDPTGLAGVVTAGLNDTPMRDWFMYWLCLMCGVQVPKPPSLPPASPPPIEGPQRPGPRRDNGT